MILRMLSAQEHDSDRVVTVIALMWNVSFTKHI